MNLIEGVWCTMDKGKASEYFSKGLEAVRNQDYQQAFICYSVAAEMGHAGAQNNLGNLYRDGNGVNQDQAAALAWYTKAADQGEPYALYNMGKCHQFGYGTQVDLPRAFQYYQKATQAGHVSSYAAVGNMLLKGNGVAKDEAAAAEWYKKGDKAGDGASTYNLGYCYRNGKGVPRDRYRALLYYRRADQVGQKNAREKANEVQQELDGAREQAEELWNQACDFYNRGEYGQSASVLAQAADLGHAGARNTLGVQYLNGYGVEQNEQIAEQLFEEAAGQGDMYACYNVGYCCHYGRGVSKDHSRALEYYLKSADQGYAMGQNEAGWLLLYGEGLQKDYGRAIDLFEQAAAQDNMYACYNLGLCYENGYGVAQDKARALEYYQQSAQLGYEEAGKQLEQLRAQQDSQPAGSGEPEEQTGAQPAEKSAMEELQELIGLDSVKREVEKAVQLHRLQQERRARGMKVTPVSMHMVFTGNPGTGKTTVARLIARAYHEMGLLEKDEVVEVDRSALVGDVIGATEKKTSSYIEQAMGGVLFIDEAYALAAEGGSNDFGPKAIEVLLKAMEDHRDKFMVIAAGYSREMQKFIDSNTGLKSRFKTFIDFPDYTAPQLFQIFCQMVKGGGYVIDPEGEIPAEQYFDKLYRTRSKDFGNGRDVRNFFDCVLLHNAERWQSQSLDNVTDEQLQTLTREDIQAAVDEQWGSVSQDKAPVLERLDAMIGLERVKEEVHALRQFALLQQKRLERGLKAESAAMHMVFTGNPGTGKTTVANLVGEIYREIGLLPKGHVIVAKREDLVGSYVGQTAPKTKAVIERAMGGVLFIDEAYTLTPRDSGNDFGQEAVDTLLTAMEENREGFAVIVAGYSGEMERFIGSNPGLKSRFTKYIHFDDYNGEDLARIFRSFAGEYTFGEGAEEELERVCRQMYEERDSNFGNARDVRNLFQAVTASLAARLSEVANPTVEELTRITREDILAARARQARNRPNTTGPLNPIGFAP